jgi:hypothetical protein
MMILGYGFILVQYDVNNNIPDELAFKVKLRVSPNNFNKYIQIAMAKSRILLRKL